MTAPNNVTPPTPPAQVPVDGGQPRAYQQKPKKPFWKKWWFWLIVVLVVLGVVGSTQSGDDTATSASTESSTQTATPKKSEKPTKPAEPAKPAKPAEKTIELQATATGNGTVMIYKAGSSSNEHFSGQWSKTYTGDEAKDLSSFSVHGDIMGGDNQQVSCKVIVNGQEKDSKDASGSAGSVMCNIPWF